MGFVRELVSKLTGADQQADAISRGAQEQAAATRAAADQAATATREATKQSAQQSAALAANSAARSAALSASEDAISKPPENPEVKIEEEVPAGTAKKRREKFGIGSAGTGVNI